MLQRHTFSRLPRSQLQHSPQLSQDYHIFEPRAEDFTLSIADRGRSPSTHGLSQSRESPYSTGPKEARRVLLALCGHAAPPPHPPAPEMPPAPGAAVQTSPLVRDVSTKVTALTENPPLKHNPFTPPKHFSAGKTSAALGRVCNPCV